MSHTTVSTAKVEKPVRSYRVQHRFWLDIARPQEDKIDREIKKMKRNRTFASTVRDGLRLMIDLKAGNTDVLCELFPWIAERLKPVQAVATRPSDEFNQILKELNRLRGEIAQRADGVPALPMSAPSAPFALSLLVDPTADTRPMQPVSAFPSQSRQNFSASIGDLFSD